MRGEREKLIAGRKGESNARNMKGIPAFPGAALRLACASCIFLICLSIHACSCSDISDLIRSKVPTASIASNSVRAGKRRSNKDATFQHALPRKARKRGRDRERKMSKVTFHH